MKGLASACEGQPYQCAAYGCRIGSSTAEERLKRAPSFLDGLGE
jgi:hypothetical protein